MMLACCRTDDENTHLALVDHYAQYIEAYKAQVGQRPRILCLGGDAAPPAPLTRQQQNKITNNLDNMIRGAKNSTKVVDGWKLTTTRGKPVSKWEVSAPPGQTAATAQELLQLLGAQRQDIDWLPCDEEQGTTQAGQRISIEWPGDNKWFTATPLRSLERKGHACVQLNAVTEMAKWSPRIEFLGSRQQGTVA